MNIVLHFVYPIPAPFQMIRGMLSVIRHFSVPVLQLSILLTLFILGGCAWLKTISPFLGDQKTTITVEMGGGAGRFVPAVYARQTYQPPLEK